GRASTAAIVPLGARPPGTTWRGRLPRRWMTSASSESRVGSGAGRARCGGGAGAGAPGGGGGAPRAGAGGPRRWFSARAWQLGPGRSARRGGGLGRRGWVAGALQRVVDRPVRATLGGRGERVAPQPVAQRDVRGALHVRVTHLVRPVQRGQGAGRLRAHQVAA